MASAGTRSQARPLGARTISALLVMGLFGQVAWTVENMYFNVFLYNAILQDTGLIALMVALSAVVATLTTLFMGAVSDRLGKRKTLIILGYVLWGLSILAFRFLAPGQALLLGTARAAALMVVLLDCVMTFFGSTANDAAFNAWVTDVTVPGNRGRAQGILNMLPLLSMLLVFGALDPLTRQGRWADFFLAVGLATLLAGLLGALLIREPPASPATDPYLPVLLHGFRPGVIRQNKRLYAALLGLAVHGIAAQVYMPYLIIYLQSYLNITDYALILGVVLLGAAALTLLSGPLIDRFGKARVAVPAVLLGALGLLGMFVSRGRPALMLSGFFMIGGSMVAAACLGGLVQDGIPPGMAGRFQGVRMIFAVLLPMVIGPFIGNAAIRGSTEHYVELGMTRQVPTPAIFPVAAAVLTLLLPVLMALGKGSHQKSGIL